MSFNLTIRNHPSQARNPIDGKPWFDDDGVYIPLFPDQRAIALDGFVIAYVSESGVIAFLAPFENLPEGCVKKAESLVEAEFMKPTKTIAPPKIEKPEPEEDED